MAKIHFKSIESQYFAPVTRMVQASTKVVVGAATGQRWNLNPPNPAYTFQATPSFTFYFGDAQFASYTGTPQGAATAVTVTANVAGEAQNGINLNCNQNQMSYNADTNAGQVGNNVSAQYAQKFTPDLDDNIQQIGLFIQTVGAGAYFLVEVRDSVSGIPGGASYGTSQLVYVPPTGDYVPVYLPMHSPVSVTHSQDYFFVVKMLVAEGGFSYYQIANLNGLSSGGGMLSSIDGGNSFSGNDTQKLKYYIFCGQNTKYVSLNAAIDIQNLENPAIYRVTLTSGDGTQVMSDSSIGFHGGAGNVPGDIVVSGPAPTDFSANLAVAINANCGSFFTAQAPQNVLSSYTGTVDGTSTPVTITANYYTDLDEVYLTFNGTSSINDLIDQWNALVPAKTIGLTSGDGTQIPSNGAGIVLTGGLTSDAVVITAGKYLLGAEGNNATCTPTTDQVASVFNGTVPGTTTPVTIQPNVAGVSGNTTIVFDGVHNINDTLGALNNLRPDQAALTVTVGDGTQVPSSATAITMAGGAGAVTTWSGASNLQRGVDATFQRTGYFSSDTYGFTMYGGSSAFPPSLRPNSAFSNGFIGLLPNDLTFNGTACSFPAWGSNGWLLPYPPAGSDGCNAPGRPDFGTADLSSFAENVYVGDVKGLLSACFGGLIQDPTLNPLNLDVNVHFVTFSDQNVQADYGFDASYFFAVVYLGNQNEPIDMTPSPVFASATSTSFGPNGGTAVSVTYPRALVWDVPGLTAGQGFPPTSSDLFTTFPNSPDPSASDDCGLSTWPHVGSRTGGSGGGTSGGIILTGAGANGLPGPYLKATGVGGSSATFFGIAPGTSTTVQINANALGPVGDITLTFDGSTSIGDTISAWNNNHFGDKQLTASAGDFSQVPTAGAVTLGGAGTCDRIGPVGAINPGDGLLMSLVLLVNTSTVDQVFMDASYVPGATASYIGTIAGTSTPVTIASQVSGAVGNNTFSWDGTFSIQQAIEGWNAKFPNQTFAIASGDGTQIPSNGASATLIGGVTASGARIWMPTNASQINFAWGSGQTAVGVTAGQTYVFTFQRANNSVYITANSITSNTGASTATGAALDDAGSADIYLLATADGSLPPTMCGLYGVSLYVPATTSQIGMYQYGSDAKCEGCFGAAVSLGNFWTNYFVQQLNTPPYYVGNVGSAPQILS